MKSFTSSSPRTRGSIFLANRWIPAFAGMTLLWACSGTSLIDPNLNANAENTATVSFSVVHHDSAGAAIAPNTAGEKEIETDQGFHVHLQEAKLNWHELRLISSGEDPECLGGNDQTIPLDHGEDLLGDDLIEALLSTATVPKVSYCEYEITLAPTAQAALKFHDGEDHGEGHGAPGLDISYHLSGTWEKGAASGSFHLEGDESVLLHGHFVTGEAGAQTEHPLHFHEGETEKALRFGTSYDALLNGIDFSVDDEAAQKSKVLENLEANIHQDTGSHHEEGEGH